METYLINLKIKYTGKNLDDLVCTLINAKDFADAEKEVKEKYLRPNIEKITILQIVITN